MFIFHFRTEFRLYMDILKAFGLTEPLIRKMAADINNDLAAIDEEAS